MARSFNLLLFLLVGACAFVFVNYAECSDELHNEVRLHGVLTSVDVVVFSVEECQIDTDELKSTLWALAQKKMPFAQHKAYVGGVDYSLLCTVKLGRAGMFNAPYPCYSECVLRVSGKGNEKKILSGLLGTVRKRCNASDMTPWFDSILDDISRKSVDVKN